MDYFLRFFENQKFVDWVLNPTGELDLYWQEYMDKHPNEKEQIKLARLLVAQLKSKESKADIDKMQLYANIVRNIEAQKSVPRIRRIGARIAQYAAIALIFFTAGLWYYQTTVPIEPDGVYNTDWLSMSSLEHPHLILEDGQNIPIEDDEPTILHQRSGEIVINQKDTIQALQTPTKKSWNRFFVPHGKSSHLTLPDGTVAHLNAGSQLVYPSDFSQSRDVYLTGEGFFEVTHNAALPFRVNTDGYEVEVLGTRFNISAYPTDKIIETVLVEGKVKLKETGLQLFTNERILAPNQRATFNRVSEETTVSTVNVDNYVSWYKGYLNAQKLELNRIIRKLEHYYNIRIQIDDPLLGLLTITGKIELNENSDTTLQVLAKTASLQLVKLNGTTYKLR